jgi:hypothetical protein
MAQDAVFRFARRWETPYIVYGGEPAEAMKHLREDGVNFFFFSNELKVLSGLPDTPLFSPGTMGKYLGIRWTDGTSYLLTWLGKDTMPIDDSFLAAYAKDPTLVVEPRKDPLFEYFKRHEGHLRPVALPWCRNCDALPPISE